jgi:hypothetical protein
MGDIGTDPYPGTQCTVTSLVYKTQDPYLEQGEGWNKSESRCHAHV